MADKQTVAVYCDFSSVSEDELKAFEKLVSPHVDDYNKMKGESLCGRVLLKYILQKYFSVKDFTLATAENGKPYIVGSELHFNFSHCLKRVICAVSDAETGCDVQDIRPFNEKVTKRFFSAEENSALSVSTEKDEQFIKLWVLKEAILKHSGDGVSGGLDRYSFAEFLSLDSFFAYNLNFRCFIKEKYIYGICSETDNIFISGTDIKDILKNLM